jgi:acyl-CoA reductase-like NAD-dependent aldehyde dehydrogenase
MKHDFTKSNYIAGVWEDASACGGETFENRNPANSDDLVGVFPQTNAAAVDRAVKAARAAFRAWSLTPAPARGMILKRTGDILAEWKEDLAVLMTREMGKILIETRGDAQEAIDTAYQMMGEGRRLYGETVPCEFKNKFGMSIRMPVGVCGVITPWNFPLAIASWCVFPALICGNTVVLKPGEDACAASVLLCKALEKAGLPKGVVNMVHGDGRTGAAMVDHPGVGLIAFTGSAEVGAEIAAKCGKNHKRVCLEMGGKNAQIVLDDADQGLALDGALWGAFGTTGQRCTATSRLILHEKIHDQFVERLVKRAKKLKIGDGLKEGTEMGPLVNKAARDKYEKYVKIGRDEDKAELLCGGKTLTQGDHAKGYFVEPTIFVGVTRQMRIFREEIFGPVLSVVKVKSFEEAVETLNDSEYGLSSSIYTRDINKAFAAIRDIEAGITYVNVPTIGAEIQLPFGGVKKTGNGHRESGHQVLDVFSEWKSVYVDYSGSLQRAQIDTEM